MNALPPGGGSEPDGYDGTGSPTIDEINDADLSMNTALELIISYWTGPWPLFHIEINQPTDHPDGTMMVSAHIAKNLLGISEISTCSVSGDDAQPSMSINPNGIAWFIDEVFSIPMILLLQITCSTVEGILRNPTTAVAAFAAGAALAAVVLTAYLTPVLFAAFLHSDGQMSDEDAFWFLWGCGWNYLIAGLTAALAGKIVAKINGPDATLLISILQGAISRLSILGKILKYSLLANIVIVALGFALWGTAIATYGWWF